ncbi:MAG: sigma-70 family RNA polymerase sigma factor [Deltaproteobacteria bacterium]|nr:sigma-70 family RNA polymerase sigma factor [Deltaproteobacteria bacterium]MDQ3298766.1 sigma-70 family RNA polymerase sigma factor [Myxococcota bacterium]
MQQEQRNQLIAQHVDMARRIALKMARRCPAHVVREDLVAAGLLGLTEAAGRYDDTRAEPFIPFAEQRIRGAVLDELRRGDLLPRRVRQTARKVATVIRKLEAAGETATDQKVADTLGVSLETYRTDLAHLVNVDVESIDGDGAMMLADAERGPDELAAHRETMHKVHGALALLEGRDATLLGLYYVEELTFQQIATSMGITPSRACQLLWRAVDRLRTRLGDQMMAEAA